MPCPYELTCPTGIYAGVIPCPEYLSVNAAVRHFTLHPHSWVRTGPEYLAYPVRDSAGPLRLSKHAITRSVHDVLVRIGFLERVVTTNAQTVYDVYVRLGLPEKATSSLIGPSKYTVRLGCPLPEKYEHVRARALTEEERC